MNGLKLFWSFVKSATDEVLDNKKAYFYFFIALIFFSNIEAIYPFLKITQESNLYIILTLISTILVFVVVSQIVLIQKRKHGGNGELKYFVPTFLLYNLYYSFLFFLGLIFVIFPGFYVLIFFSMVPFVAVLDDEENGSFFKKSRELVKKNIGLVAWASFINLFLELSALLFAPIQNPTLKSVLTFIFSIPDAFFTIIFTIATVKIFYYLKKI